MAESKRVEELLAASVHAPKFGLNGRELLLQAARLRHVEEDFIFKKKAPSAAAPKPIPGGSHAQHAQRAQRGVPSVSGSHASLFIHAESLCAGIPVKETPTVAWNPKSKVPRGERLTVLRRLSGEHLALELHAEGLPLIPGSVARYHAVRQRALARASELEEKEIYTKCTGRPTYIALAVRVSATPPVPEEPVGPPAASLDANGGEALIDDLFGSPVRVSPEGDAPPVGDRDGGSDTQIFGPDQGLDTPFEDQGLDAPFAGERDSLRVDASVGDPRVVEGQEVGADGGAVSNAASAQPLAASSVVAFSQGGASSSAASMGPASPTHGAASPKPATAWDPASPSHATASTSGEAAPSSSSTPSPAPFFVDGESHGASHGGPFNPTGQAISGYSNATGQATSGYFIPTGQATSGCSIPPDVALPLDLGISPADLLAAVLKAAGAVPAGERNPNPDVLKGSGAVLAGERNPNPGGEFTSGNGNPISGGTVPTGERNPTPDGVVPSGNGNPISVCTVLAGERNAKLGPLHVGSPTDAPAGETNPNPGEQVPEDALPSPVRQGEAALQLGKPGERKRPELADSVTSAPEGIPNVVNTRSEHQGARPAQEPVERKNTEADARSVPGGEHAALGVVGVTPGERNRKRVSTLGQGGEAAPSGDGAGPGERNPNVENPPGGFQCGSSVPLGESDTPGSGGTEAGETHCNSASFLGARSANVGDEHQGKSITQESYEGEAGEMPRNPAVIGAGQADVGDERQGESTTQDKKVGEAGETPRSSAVFLRASSADVGDERQGDSAPHVIGGAEGGEANPRVDDERTGGGPGVANRSPVREGRSGPLDVGGAEPGEGNSNKNAADCARQDPDTRPLSQRESPTDEVGGAKAGEGDCAPVEGGKAENHDAEVLGTVEIKATDSGGEKTFETGSEGPGMGLNPQPRTAEGNPLRKGAEEGAGSEFSQQATNAATYLGMGGSHSASKGGEEGAGPMGSYQEAGPAAAMDVDASRSAFGDEGDEPGQGSVPKTPPPAVEEPGSLSQGSEEHREGKKAGRREKHIPAEATQAVYRQELNPGPPAEVADNAPTIPTNVSTTLSYVAGTGGFDTKKGAGLDERGGEGKSRNDNQQRKRPADPQCKKAHEGGFDTKKGEGVDKRGGEGKSRKDDQRRKRSADPKCEKARADKKARHGTRTASSVLIIPGYDDEPTGRAAPSGFHSSASRGAPVPRSSDGGRGSGGTGQGSSHSPATGCPPGHFPAQPPSLPPLPAEWLPPLPPGETPPLAPAGGPPAPPGAPQAVVNDAVLRFVRSILDPLYAAQVIDKELYRKVAKKSVEKVMRSHAEATEASFLVREGVRIHKLVQQYIQLYMSQQPPRPPPPLPPL